MQPICTDLYRSYSIAGVLLLHFYHRKGLIEAPAVTVSEKLGKVSLSMIKLSWPSFTNCSPVECMFSLTFLHLNTKPTDGWMPPFLNHLLVSVQLVPVLPPHTAFEVCVTATHTLCVCVCVLMLATSYTCDHVCAACHDGERSTESVMLHGMRVLVTALTAEPVD